MIQLRPHNLYNSFSMRKWITAFVLLTATLASGQQIADSVYWVYFTDKTNNGYQYDQPYEFLSERSVQRRAWQGLGVGMSDEPVTRAYVDALVALGAEVRHVSRWLNGVVMVNADEDLFQEVLALPFVDTFAWIPESQALWFPPAPSGERFEPPMESPPDYSYGVAKEQILDRLQPKTRLYYHDFQICAACQQVYWKGSHFKQLQSFIAQISHVEQPDSHPD